MGQRANLVIVKEDGYDLYYNHWCANTLPRDLFWGPDHAVSFIQAQIKVEHTEWLNDVWAEGGAVIDEERKLLLLYGGEETQFDIPYRRLFLELMQKVWGDWEIRWAHEGIVALAEYVGVPRDIVLSGRCDDLLDVSLEPPSEMDWVDTIGSITLENEQSMIFPLIGGIGGYLMQGPVLIQNINKSYAYMQCNLEEWSSNFPSSGFHIDMNKKRIEVWYAEALPITFHRIQEKWPDWQVINHHDRYEAHTEILNGKLQFQTMDRSKVLMGIKSLLLQSSTNPLDTLSSLVARLQQEDKDVKVSPHAYMHVNYDMPDRIREDIISYVFTEIEKDWK